MKEILFWKNIYKKLPLEARIQNGFLYIKMKTDNRIQDILVLLSGLEIN